MNILVVGLGSMGKRRIRLFKKDVSAISHLWSGSECTTMCVCKERVRNGDISDDGRSCFAKKI